MVQPPNLFPKHDTRDHSGTGGTQAPPQRDGIHDVDMGLDGECALVVTAQHVEGDAGDQVRRGVKRDIFCALSLVGDPAVERLLGRRF